MSGDNYYFGDSVTMHGGRDNVGIDKRQTVSGDASEASAEMLSAVQELLRLVEELRTQVPAASARTIEDAVPAISPDTEAQPQDRHRALMAIAGIAATVGAVGQPVLEAVNRVLGLLGGQ
ncbi:hypothetical protein [Streptomyces sp. AC550_RSS872]|uniref:hypothetical protein n=1 Tax=Streptomyces sp. AC550_RSS872 TaxID=2823689 RepID=UPI001C2797ED|nr:hypothetical protein [Streptomyces sp. AC550_RSS872]